MNILKFLNSKLVNYQMKKGHTFLFGKPYLLVLDTTSFCNIECVWCPTGQHRNSRTSCIMPKEKAINIINYFSRYLKVILLFNWGEPLLNPYITDIIKTIKKHNIYSILSSNLNIDFTEQTAYKFITSGLNYLICSIDGASQETYEKYRKRGSFQKAFNNLKLLIKTKKELNLKEPFIEWQYLVFRHNENEIEQAKQMAKEIGVDKINFAKPWCPKDWVSTIDKYSNYNIKKDVKEYKKYNNYCNWLWNGIVINANGSVSPCCSVENESEDFGNIFETPFYKLWNNKNYREARKYNITRKKTKILNRCTTCEHIGTANHGCK